MSLSGTSMASWATAILGGIDAPITANNIANLTAWHACEQSSFANNPFNTMWGSPSGIGNYPDYSTGLQATVATILQPTMAPISTALRADSNRQAFAAAVGNTRWGTNPACIAGNHTAPSGSGAATSSGGSSGCVLKLPLVGCVLPDGRAAAMLGVLVLVAGAGLALFGLVMAVESRPGSIAHKVASALPLPSVSEPAAAASGATAPAAAGPSLVGLAAA